jgi:hypothetical protein
MARPRSFQIALPDGEKSKLVDRIEQDFLTDKATHLRWAERCRGWMQKWEARVDPPGAGNEDKPNHVVPLVQWQCFNKLARDMQALLGDEAAITARATGPDDARKIHKVGCYMTSRVFDQMEITNPLAVFEFRRILNGHAAAYRPWYRREFDTIQHGQVKRVCDYEGPGFFPLEPDDLMVPPERGVLSLQDFSHVIRRVRYTVDDLQRGDGTLFQGTSDPEFVRQLISWAKSGDIANDYTLAGMDPVRTEREKSEGVDYDYYVLGRRGIWVWEWYGAWRPLKKYKRSAEVDDLEKRLPYEADWVVRYIPGLRKIVGVQDLLELYPKMRKRRPFVESTLIKDGTYRPKWFGALLEDLENDATANSRLFTAAGELSVWPIIFFKPGGGFNQKAFKVQPGMAYPTEDPTSVNVVKITPNLEYAMAKQQDILATSERVTGITDQSLGRAIDRPNAPKTATGQLALIEEGNIRAYLDSAILREDFEAIITEFWELDCDLAPKTEPGIFFRTTGEAANGLFDIKAGGAYMTAKEFGGRYDFKLKFATSVYARQQKKAEILGFYQLVSQNPLIATNPKALWSITNRVATEFGITDFATLVPPPPDLDEPQTPDREWSRMLEGETDVHVNPQDNDDLHLVKHTGQLEDARRDPDRDVKAIAQMVKHVLDTQQQKRTKMLMQALTSHLVNQLNPGPGGVPDASAGRGQGPGGLPPNLAAMYGGGGSAPPGGGMQSGVNQPPANGDIPPGPQQAGATMAPQPHDGML